MNGGLARMLQGKLAEARVDFEECLKLDRSLSASVEEAIEEIGRQLQLKR